MDLKYFKNTSKNEFELILSGDVGIEINGKQIADEIRYLNSIGATKITERINSGGGFVLDGYDIVDANINSKAIIETIITGLAASTAGWLAATGTKGYRFIVDYGKAMIHDPSVGDKSLEEMEDGKDKNGLLAIKDSISTILSNNSILDKDAISSMMTKETWLSADQWVSLGFADKVIFKDAKPVFSSKTTMFEFMNICHNFNNKIINNKMDIQELENKVQNLSGQITAKDTRISELENKVTEKDTKIDEIENKVTEKEAEISELNNKVKEFETKEVENAVKSAISLGKFSEENKETLIEQAASMGVENFNKMVEMVKLPQTNVINQINDEGTKAKKDSNEEKLAKEYEELSTNNVDELIRIKNIEPERFEKMLNAFNKF